MDAIDTAGENTIVEAIGDSGEIGLSFESWSVESETSRGERCC